MSTSINKVEQREEELVSTLGKRKHDNNNNKNNDDNDDVKNEVSQIPTDEDGTDTKKQKLFEVTKNETIVTTKVPTAVESVTTVVDQQNDVPKSSDAGKILASPPPPTRQAAQNNDVDDHPSKHVNSTNTIPVPDFVRTRHCITPQPSNVGVAVPPRTVGKNHESWNDSDSDNGGGIRTFNPEDLLPRPSNIVSPSRVDDTSSTEGGVASSNNTISENMEENEMDEDVDDTTTPRTASTKEKTETSKQTQSKTVSACRIIGLAIFYFVVLTGIHGKLSPPTSSLVVPPNSVYVSGGGFSGFWYTLGRLYSFQSDTSKQFYCYSSGCLAVVTSLSGYSMEHVLDVALDIQSRWKDGSLHRYDVMPSFVDALVTCQQHNVRPNSFTCSQDEDGNWIHPLSDSRVLNRINVITTTIPEYDAKSSSLIMNPVVTRTAQSVNELQQLLLQTSWIPYVVANGTSLQGHIDGAFSVPFHPTTEYTVGLTWDLDLLLNVLNINLQPNKVHRLFEKGLQYGL